MSSQIPNIPGIVRLMAAGFVFKSFTDERGVTLWQYDHVASARESGVQAFQGKSGESLFRVNYSDSDDFPDDWRIYHQGESVVVLPSNPCRQSRLKNVVNFLKSRFLDSDRPPRMEPHVRIGAAELRHQLKQQLHAAE